MSFNKMNGIIAKTRKSQGGRSHNKFTQTTKKWMPDPTGGYVHKGHGVTLERNKALEVEWKRMLNAPSVSYSDPNQWRKSPDVRPSSFPFCARKYVLDRLGIPEHDDSGGVKMNFYTSIGIALHEVVQNALGTSGRLWGFWQCARPTCKSMWNSAKKPSLSPMTTKDRCKSCNSKTFNYEELTMGDEDIGMVMHCDGIFLGEDKSGVLEIKTAGKDKVEWLKSLSQEQLNHILNSSSPWFGYIRQATCYAIHAMLTYPEKLRNLQYIDFLVLARDDPFTYFSCRVDLNTEIWEEIRADIKMARYALKKKILPQGLDKELKHPACRWCDKKAVCPKENADGYVDVVSDAWYCDKAKKKLSKKLKKEYIKYEDKLIGLGVKKS